ncbi:restriction endonuclease subunit S [Leifsonia sp. McL0607]|uniref:restriction endonuclease subunit S n=1 Tax=Leifsonia sp. McL0607 TaxID=3415672 RepID=UPI003CF3D70A
MIPSLVPEVPLKFVGQIVSGGTPKSEPANWNGELPFITPPDLNGLDGKVVAEWDRTLTDQGASESSVVNHAVLLSCRAPIGHIGVASRSVAFNQGCKAIIPERPEDLRYLAYCLIANRKGLEAVGRGTTFTELSTTELAAFRVPWPAQSQRMLVADFLDRETNKVDVMLGRLAELVELLIARREAIVDRAFSVLLDLPTVSVQMVADVTVGIVVEPAKLYVDDGGVPALRGLNISPGKILAEDVVRISHEGHAANLKSELRTGDLVTVRTGRVGSTAVVSDEWSGANAIDLVITRPQPGIVPQFMYWLLSSSASRRHIDAVAVGSVQSHFNVGALKRLRVPIVDVCAQQRIADQLDDATGKVDAMLAKVGDLKSLLLERRTALITDVVTGRKEIA